MTPEREKTLIAEEALNHWATGDMKGAYRYLYSEPEVLRLALLVGDLPFETEDKYVAWLESRQGEIDRISDNAIDILSKEVKI